MTENEALTEADAQLSSPPDDGVALESTPTQDDQATSNAAAPDVPEGGQPVDRDQVAMQRLMAGEDPKSIRQNPSAVAPSPDASDPSDAGQGAAATNGAAAAAGPALSDQDGYAGLDKKGLDTLKRAGVVVDRDDWNVLSQRGRQQQLTNARRILSERGRVGQQLGQQQRTNQAAPDSGGGEDFEDEGHDGDVEDPPRTSRGVRARESAAARPDDSETSAGTDEALQEIVDAYGEEFAKPIRNLLERQSRALTDSQQQQQQLQATLEALARQQLMPLEEKAFGELTKLAGEITPEQRAEITDDAVALMEAASRRNQKITWDQAITKAGNAALTPNIQQHAQQTLLSDRNRSLRGSPTKASGTPRGVTRMTAEDRDRASMQMLAAGKSPREVREALSR